MDKEYDSEKIHSLNIEEIRTYSIISARKRETKIWGKYKRQLYLIFDKNKYNRKNNNGDNVLCSKRSLEILLGQESSIFKSNK
jgi:hypothetical protein